MILDRLLLTCGDEKLQDEVLAKDWDLKTFMKHATMKQDIKAQTDDMKSEIKEESPEFVRAAYKGARGRGSTKSKMYSFRNTKNPKDMNKSRSVHTKSQRKCLRCEYDASHEICPAIGKICNSCGKPNHFSSCCRTKPKESESRKKVQKAVTKDDMSDSDSDIDIDIQGARLKLNVKRVKAGKNASNILLPVTVCGVELDIDPDTGADVDLISKDDFQKIYQKCPDVAKLITVSKEAIRALDGAKLGIICVLKGATLSNKTVKNLVRNVYVTENGIHNHPLLSEKTLLELGMVQYSADGKFADRKIKNVEKNVESNKEEFKEDLTEKKGIATMEKILSTHKKLFEGVGRLRDPHNDELILTHIHMNPEAEPVVQPPRVIPHHLRERTKKKLDYFVKEGIMSWTEPGEPIVYASPLVITPK